MPRPEDHVRVLRLGEREDRGEVGVVLAELLVDDQLQPCFLRELARPVGHGDVEGIVGCDQRHVLRLRVELAHHLDGAREVVVRGRERAEHVLVAAAEDLRGGAAALHHRHLVLLRNGRVVERVVGGERPEQEVHLVLREQLHVLPHAEVGVRLAVVDAQRQLVLGAADRDAALRVDLVDGNLIAVAVVASCIRQPASQLHGCAQRDLLVLTRSGAREGQGSCQHRERHRTAESFVRHRRRFRKS